MINSNQSKDKAIYSSPVAIAVLSIICCALWGSAVPAVRFGFKALGVSVQEGGSQLLFAGVRFFIAGVFIALYYAISNKDFRLPTKDEFICICKLSLAQTVGQYFFYYEGLAHATGVNASIIQGVGVFVAVIMSCVIYKMEDLTRNKILGCVLGFIGIVATSGAGAADTGFSFWGEGFLLIAAVFGSQAVIYTRRFSQIMPPVMLSGWQFAVGGIVLSVLGKLKGGSVVFDTPGKWGILMWLVMVSTVAYVMWSQLLKANDVSKIMIFKFTTPIFGVLLSLLILGSEGADLGIHTFVGLVLICLGIICVQRPAKTK